MALLALAGLAATTGCGSGGCLMPYVSIPARIEIGGISAHGSIPSLQEDGQLEESGSAKMLHLRAGINPMQGFNGWHGRSWDVGGGYLAQWLWPEGQPNLLYHGFYLEGAWFPLTPEKDESGLRLSLVADAEVVLSGFGDGAEVGPGGSLGAFLEWSGTASTSYAKKTGGGMGSSAGAIGALYGEWSAGLGVSLGYRRLWGMNYLTIMVGLTFRLPFGAGLAGISN